jgi:hypothetical protein
MYISPTLIANAPAGTPAPFIILVGPGRVIPCVAVDITTLPLATVTVPLTLVPPVILPILVTPVPPVPTVVVPAPELFIVVVPSIEVGPGAIVKAEKSPVPPETEDQVATLATTLVKTQASLFNGQIHNVPNGALSLVKGARLAIIGELKTFISGSVNPYALN